MTVKKRGPFLIAEIGVNHNGSLERALYLVEKASRAGFDAVKFQHFDPHKLVLPTAELADYQVHATKATNQLEMLENLKLAQSDFERIIKECHSCNIEFMATAFDEANLDFIVSLRARRIKVPSGEITNYKFLDKVASINLPTILSTGASTFDEVESAVGYLISSGLTSQLDLLHCVSAYPPNISDLNLNVIPTLKKIHGVSRCGYSDHSPKVFTSVAAIALGADIVEKHVTFDQEAEGPDHSMSLPVDSFEDFVQSCRLTFQAKGSTEKQVVASEEKNRPLIRRSIFAARDISSGEKFSEDNLIVRRPASGICASRYNEVLGKVSQEAIKKFDPIKI